MVLIGNPGTGKSTVAGIVAKTYKELGILSQGQIIEVKSTELNSAVSVEQICQQAKGGILVINEADSLSKNALVASALLSEMEKNKDLIVFFAGYDMNKMKQFTESNPDLNLKFNKYLNFPNCTAPQMVELLERVAKEEDYVLSPQARLYANNYFANVLKNGRNFNNVKEVKNFFENAKIAQFKRLCKIVNPDKNTLMTIEESDFSVVPKMSMQLM